MAKKRLQKKREAARTASPKTTTPIKETAKTAAINVETTKTETPKVETKKVEPLKVETAKTDAPKVETKKVEPVKVETAKTDAPKVASQKAAAEIPVRDDDAIYCERLSRHLDELKWLYCELYQDNPYVTMHLNDLLTVLKKFYDMRSNDLKESDIRRAKDPKWYLSLIHI